MARRPKPASRPRPQATSVPTAAVGTSSGPEGKMEREFSAGGVVVRRVGAASKTGPWEIAVIEPRREDTGDSGKSVLALPKGWVDAGEKPEQTAWREIKEEAGLDAEILTKLGDIKYVYVRKWSDGARVFKVVSFYRLRYVSGT